MKKIIIVMISICFTLGLTNLSFAKSREDRQWSRVVKAWVERKWNPKGESGKERQSNQNQQDSSTSSQEDSSSASLDNSSTNASTTSASSTSYSSTSSQDDSSSTPQDDSSTSFNFFECVYPEPVTNLGPEEIHTFSVSLDADETDGPAQLRGYAKFGVFDIEQAVADGDPVSLDHKTLDIDLMPAENPDYILGATPGYFLYSCSGDPDNRCAAELVGFAEAINIQLAATCGGSPEDFSWESATFLGIFFRIDEMDPAEVCGLYGDELLDGLITEDTLSEPFSSNSGTDQTSGGTSEDTNLQSFATEANSLQSVEGDPLGESSNSSCDIDWLFTANFETGDWSEWYHPFWNTGAQFDEWTMNVTQDNPYRGNYSGELWVDTYKDEIVSIRLAINQDLDNARLPRELWTSHYFYIPSGTNIDTWYNIWDWKIAHYQGCPSQTDRISQPAFNLGLLDVNGGEQYRIRVTDRMGDNCIYNQTLTTRATSPDFEPDQWHHLECHYKYTEEGEVGSIAKDGFIKCWLDGVQWANVENVYTNMCLPLQCYDKGNKRYTVKPNHYTQGVTPAEMTVWIDDVGVASERIGNCPIPDISHGRYLPYVTTP